ncbi:GNAT family N-acetyltransferase [Yunchengibacter salinarum]|uniref:GNAT family N-acetyltransferase n=1 Tax=Yunchengibacter salinarum TaxID=3133399 RepID=UPI0035B633C3
MTRWAMATLSALWAKADRARRVARRPIRLRPLGPRDARAFLAVVSDSDTIRNAATLPMRPDLAWARARLAERLGRDPAIHREFAVMAGRRMVGHALYFLNLRDEREIGYSIHPDYRGHGLASRVVPLLLAELQAATGHSGPVTALYAQDNPASGRVLEKAGFRITGAHAAPSLGRGNELVPLWRAEIVLPAQPDQL